jgi:chlorite dismutase
MQFMAIRNVTTAGLVAHLESTHAAAVVYQDLNDPRGIGLLLFNEDPDYFVRTMQDLLVLPEMSRAEFKDEFTMLGRTYSLGYEDNLEDVLLHRSAHRVCDPATPWAVWYPVRRSGRFEQESREEQRRMLMEHGGIGHAYGKAGYATDIRLAAHGLNRNDNDFIVGLIGKDLFPLSALVQHMRRTKQTSEFIQHMGPFFVGRVIWQSKSL